ncbi:hypothetical protein [Alcaligenes faecalis]|uniref:Helix-turn-helix domain-containing protein n=1 Tax=Alcaligenes faecalis TaxID=511 RepID=A0A2U2BLN5_ALCFA|nr:hypothetical protein [Alcaligenes faecalis]PWE14935.1 hypothetical protein DF183_09645 [Alcaligenes faecalis]
MSAESFTLHKQFNHGNFTIVPNSLIHKGEVSLCALGLWTLLNSYHANMTLSIAFLAKVRRKNGRDSIRGKVRELQELGYLNIDRTRDAAGRYNNSDWTLISDRSPSSDSHTLTQRAKRFIQAKSPGSVNPRPENPSVDKPPMANPTQSNTSSTEILSVINTTTKAHRDLLFPPQLTSEEHQSITNGLKGLSVQDAQLLLDELTHAIQANKIKSSRVGWLFSVKKKLLAGQFNPVGASKIASQRKQASAQSSVPPVETHPVDKQRGQAETRKLMKLLTTSKHQKQA